VRRLGRILAVLVLGGVAFAALSFAFIGWSGEGSDEYPDGLVLRDASGAILRVGLGPGDTDCRPFYTASADDWIVKALVASEDGSFWTHRGVRPLSILRAAWQNVFYRRRISGASTITMQAVRLIRPHPKTLWWKWKEAVKAVKMEHVRSKTWILSQYLNRAPFGANFVGIEAAAQGWFGKGAKDLGLSEAAMLAGMVQAPSRFRPDRGYDRALKRRDYVLGRMHALGFITDDQLEGAKGVRPQLERAKRPFLAPHYCDWTERRLKAAGRTHGDVRTALEPDIQALCEHAVRSASEAGGYSAAAVVQKVPTGEVVALACSGDYFDRADGQVNTALAPRPAGSTLKPFLTALALDRGLVTPEERILDAPMAVKGYRPANFDAQYRGRVTVRDALVLSLNIPFVQLLRQVGVTSFADTLRALGFRQLNAPDESFGLGLAIGNAEVTLVELVGAYATLARGGRDIFSPAASYLVSDMLSGDERSAAAFGHVADVKCVRFAWKTGTSSAYRDAWTVLWNPEYVVGVWCGHKQGGFGDTKLVGAKAAAPVAWGIARQLYPQQAGPWFARPEAVATRRVCALTGLPAAPECAETEEARWIRGRSATTLCAAHRRGADGTVRTETSSAAVRLAISKPQDGSTFRRVPGTLDQKIVCQAVGNPDGAKLWWFVNDRPVGEVTGSQPLPVEMVEGTNVISCTTSDGRTATVRCTVVE